MNWKDIFMDEDAPENPTVQLPKENEQKGEDNGSGSPAAGALPEDGNPQGVKDLPEGKDPITGDDSKEFDDIFKFLDEDGNEDEEGKKKEKDDDTTEEDPDKKKTEEEGKEDPDEASGKKTKKAVKSAWDLIFDEDAPENPTVDLPKENEKPGEDNGSGSEAAGALSEKDDPAGTKVVPEGTDPITGDDSKEFDDYLKLLASANKAKKCPKCGGDLPCSCDNCDGKGGKKKVKNSIAALFDVDEDEDDKKEEKKEDEPKKKADKEGTDDDGVAEKKEPTEGEPDGKKEDKDDKKDDKKDDEDIQDWLKLFDEEGEETPDNLPGTTEPAKPVDQDGKPVDPIGDPDLPDNLTEPVLVPVSTPAGETAPLANRRHISDRFFFA